MPPRLNILSASRSLTIRSRTSIASFNPRLSSPVSRRGYADDKTPPAKGPNQDVLGHVSEEAADMGRITGETKPDLGQGTLVQDILKRDEEGNEKAPEIIKDEIKGLEKSATPSEAAGEVEPIDSDTFDNLLALGQLDNIAHGGSAEDPVDMQKRPGFKFDSFSPPWPKEMNVENRYEPIIDQITNLLMRDGKKSVAQRNLSFILNTLRTAPPPIPNPTRPLLPGSPPPSHLPLDPIGYLSLAIDSVAPLLRIRSQRGAAGGGAALQIPVPLGLRQRRRQAFMWILNAAEKKRSRGSGRGMFAQRVADEIISVAEGKSSAWEKRLLVHKTGTTARTNLGFRKKKRN